MQPLALVRLLGRTAWIEWIALFAAAALLAWGLVATRIVDPLDALIHDAIVRATPHTPDARVLIVAIDDASIRAIGHWPWSREVHARLIDRLAAQRVAAIGYDVLFVDPGPGDAALSAAAAAAGNVAMPVLVEVPGENGAPFAVRMPVAAGVVPGHVVVRPDPDGIVRRALLHDSAVTAGKPHLAMEIARIAAGGKSAQSIDAGLIPYAGPPGTYSTVSFASVLRGEVPGEFLRNRIVLVGATAPGLGDRFATPIGGDLDLMPGVEIQANIVDAVLNRRMRTDESGTMARLALSAAVLLALWLAFLLLSPRANIAAAVVLVAVLLGMSAALLVFGGIWIAPGAALVAIMVMFPLWGWRRLAAASRYLDGEIGRLGGADTAIASGGDRIARQIALLDAASERIGTLRRQRDETLAFLSHDLRSPAAAILTLVPDDKRVANHARRLLRLADQFVQGLRAEEAPLLIEEVEPAAILDEAADNCWEAAERVGGRVEVGADWDLRTIATDRTLLSRVVCNLIDNALKYGGAAPVVHGRAWSRDGRTVITIADSGPGIPPERIDTLFDRFDRGGAAGPDGAGLGLALVATYARRQGGQVRCISKAGVGTLFELSLPGL